MGSKDVQERREETVECGYCDSIISIAPSCRRGAVLCCEACDTEYSLTSRKPLTLEPLEDDEESLYAMLSSYETADDDFNVGDYLYADDDYSDGRYD